MNRRCRASLWPAAVLITLAPFMGRTGAADRAPSGPAEPVLQPKRQIESPVKQVIHDRSGPAAAAPADFVNPKVEPGKVRWHASFAAACTAAQQSGKPVLLFHLMGKLDDQFC